MTLIIVAILLLSFILIATERLTNINKAAVAVFAGTVGWVLYICWGTDFVMSQHPSGYFNFLQGAVATSTAVKQYIAKSIFLPYVGKASEVVLFLLATMTIVEVLYNNGCFDFITQILKTRNSKRMLWTLVIITFLVSINLDNLTTTVMMLTIMHGIIPSRRQRMILGSAILIAATAGGTLTVIGNPENLVLWNMGAVTASNLSATLLVPCVTTCVVSVLLLQRMLPDRLDTEWIVMPYRGDDTNLNVWQRLLMLFVGLGGLWLIPTLHDITKLSPFLGAFCVLAVLWIVNEIINRKLFNNDQMLQRRELRVMQYGVIQMMLYVMGMMFAVGVVQETGGNSASVNGSKSGGTVVYNPFNIGASGKNAVSKGLAYAKKMGWTTPEKAVNGAASYIASGYINKKQNTLYLQKFNVANGASKVGTHQYMTNVMAPYSEAYITKKSYAKMGITNEPLAFVIPVFTGMPDKTKLP